jgi:hypothetical protein
LEVFLISVSVFVFTSSNEIFSHQVMLHLLDWNSILCSATICLLASVPFAYCIYHLQCNVVIISVSIALNKTSLDVYNAIAYKALSGSHLISLAYISICFSQLFVGEGFNTTVKCPSSHHYR